MATVTALTAARMLAIEAASVVDGEIVGDDLILTRQSGAQINAGDVRGPAGPTGPTGSDLAVISSLPIQDAGISGQIRAGRQLTAADFTAMGLQAPAGLWNLSNVNDSSGNGRNLTNKGTVTFDKGINGAATTAAQFKRLATQALYRDDTGAADPFRIKTGSVGAWFRSPKKGVYQTIVSKYASADGQHAWLLQLDSSNRIEFSVTSTGLQAGFLGTLSGSNYIDDRWHFAVGVADGARIYLYVDGTIASSVPASGGPIFGGSAPLVIGGASANAGTNSTNPFGGRIDEVFVTPDILSASQVRNLYCAKIAHSLGAVPKRASVLISRRKRGPALVTADFPSTPARLYNFSGGSLTDLGSNGVTLTAVNSPTSVPGVDGAAGNAYLLQASASQQFRATDVGLPGTSTSRSYGGWFKVPAVQGDPAILSFGTTPGGTTVAEALYVNNTGFLVSRNYSDDIAGPYVVGTDWFFAVVTENYSPVTDVKRMLYVNGALVGSSVNLSNVNLGGADRFRIGQWADGAWGVFFGGLVDSVFVCSYVLDQPDIAALYAKGSQALGVLQYPTGDYIEQMTSTDLLCRFDGPESNHLVSVSVA